MQKKPLRIFSFLLVLSVFAGFLFVASACSSARRTGASAGEETFSSGNLPRLLVLNLGPGG